VTIAVPSKGIPFMRYTQLLTVRLSPNWVREGSPKAQNRTGCPHSTPLSLAPFSGNLDTHISAKTLFLPFSLLQTRRCAHSTHTPYITGYASGLRCSQPVYQKQSHCFSPSHDSFAAPATRLTTGPELRHEGSSRTTACYRYHTHQTRIKC
jgi:hypothetical protein